MIHDLFSAGGSISRMPLRPYQSEAKDSTIMGFDEVGKQLVVIPTGGGKTILFAHLADHYASKGKKTLILAHREELLVQAKDKIQRSVGLWCELEKAEHRASIDSPVVVGSIQTLASKRRLGQWSPDHFGLIVVDEAHHVLADSYRRVLSHFDAHAHVLGVTATPDRGDKKNLGAYFERVAYEISLIRLIKDGYLAPIKVKTLPVRIDLTKVKKVAGDFSADDLGREIDVWLERVADAMAGEAWDRKTIVFLPLVKTAERMTAVLRDRGFDCRSVSGYDSNRDETLEWFSKAGPGSVLCNAMLLTEGFDQPDVDCVVCLRPTQVRALYAQMVGRGTRLSPETGKQHLLLLDFLWQTESLSLVSAASLVVGNREDQAAVQQMLIDVKPGRPPEEIDLVEASEDVEEQRFKKVQDALKANSRRQAGTIDAVELCMSIGAVELMDYEPMSARDARPITEGQKAALERAGFDTSSIATLGHASAILDRLAVRRMEGLATPKQVRLLAKLHHPKPECATFAEAGEWIGLHMGGRR